MLFTVLLLSVSTSAFSDDRDEHKGKSVVIKVKVNAATGGTFTDNVANPGIEVSIPAGALESDAVLTVKEIKPYKKYAKKIGEAQSSAFKITLLTKSGDDDDHLKPVTILEPITIALAADPLPIHPQIGELARFIGKGWKGEWRRMMTNFYRPSTGMVASLTKLAVLKLKVRHRTLQAATGPAVERGKDMYFNKTWGAEPMWTDRYHLDLLLPNVTPVMAVGLGVQVDIRKVPQPMIDLLVGTDYAAKHAALNDTATTIALLQLDAIVGVKAQFNNPNNPNEISRVGLTCALCHVAVTKTPIVMEAGQPAMPMPFGVPVLGPPNVSMNAGGILGASPFITELQSFPLPVEHNHTRSPSDPNGPLITEADLNGVPASEIAAQLGRWGPGRLDPRFFIGNPVNDNVENPSSIPPHWNYSDLGEQGYSVPWIGVTVMRPDNHSLASGPECGVDLVLGTNGAWGTATATITDIEIGNPLPANFLTNILQAEADEPGNVVLRDDILDIEAFLKSIVSPAPGVFDERLAEQGWELFFGKANCVACHSTPEGTGPGYFTNITANPPQGLLANGIKVPGLRGLVHTAPYFHDGSAATLFDVMKRYTSDDIPQVPNDLTDAELTALAEYMKTL